MAGLFGRTIAAAARQQIKGLQLIAGCASVNRAPRSRKCEVRGSKAPIFCVLTRRLRTLKCAALVFRTSFAALVRIPSWFRFRVLAVLSVLMLTACASAPHKGGFTERSADILYNDAMNQLFDKDYSSAARTFDKVDAEHPYSIWATKAELMKAYALYQASHYNASIEAADSYIGLHPGDSDVDYAYYLKALDYYIQIDNVDLDQTDTRYALNALTQVIRRFPKSKYARDAKFKIDFVRSQLAGHDMAIGRFYEHRGDYLAAINRYRTVVKKYQTTPFIKEALARLTECYYALGLTHEAQRVAAVLGYNYPSSKWYKAAYALLKNGSETPHRKSSQSFFAEIMDPLGHVF